ncbi:FadR/GntR family transcriptional regulator [Rathayibacter sp. VKM Ac-2760]|uniref:FadR/GntR family transcriptional regulator n=1 Tax=Rathayibacter sp. VKM Ac-2760 TaxID=2609253 RepID=UPI001315EA2B|nr:FadR/GntR family transcriptional regulator [Rathayibacter sp. VKM Ac-2760]QHC60401.1 FCD domain-containing protein [Rathayibacter sp. VKM Ac-2760]
MTNSPTTEFRHRPRSLGSELAAHLESLISSGHYPPGSSLPAERRLAADLGVSRTSLRDAMAELEAKRLIHRSQGRPSVVAMPTPDELAFAERLNSLKERVEHVIELENVFEPGLAALAASRSTTADVLQLDSIIANSNEHLPPAESLALDVQFHYALARLTRNNFVIALSGLNAERTQEIRVRAHETIDSRRAIIVGHREIAAAIEAGDPAAAEQAMRRHLAVVHEYMHAAESTED